VEGKAGTPHGSGKPTGEPVYAGYCQPPAPIGRSFPHYRLSEGVMNNFDLILATFGDDHPHRLIAVPIGQTPEQAFDGPIISGAFKVDSGCVDVALNDPALSTYTDRGCPVIFACSRKVDLKKLFDRRATFAALGYKLWRAE
jgi:hypothetical protein